MKTLTLLFSVLLSASLPARDFVTANDQARFIAGLALPSGSPLEPYTHDPGWKAHAAEMDAAWIKCETKSLAKTRAWAGTFIGRAHRSNAPMFYMFSGPDILFANTMFPDASTYVLCGTEPIGNVPDITRLDHGAIDPALGNLRKTLSTVLRFSYFITKDMRVDLADQRLGGTLPVFYFFLARLGYTIESTQFVNLDSGGNLGRGRTPGVKVTFSGGGGRSQTLYYFKSDLSNSGVGSGGVLPFCRKHGQGNGLLKAASFLLHEGGFSTVRDFLLTSCRVLVQDDSGVPVRYFDPVRWQVRYFGNYGGTTELFAKYYQPDLMEKYQRTSPAPLDFVLSYQWNPKQAVIMVATQTGAPPPPRAEQAIPSKAAKRAPARTLRRKSP